MGSNWFTISLIVFLTVLFLALWESPPALLTGKDNQTAPTEMLPFAIVTGADSESYDKTGKITHKISATQLQYFRRSDKHTSKEDYTLLEQPYLILFEREIPWFGEALQGKLSGDSKVFTLMGKVRIWQENQRQLTEFTSSELTIKPDSKQLTTAAKVKIISPYGTTESTGLMADLKSKRLQLLHDVRGVYEPL